MASECGVGTAGARLSGVRLKCLGFRVLLPRGVGKTI